MRAPRRSGSSRKGPCTLGGARLPAQGRGAIVHLREDVGEAFEIGLAGTQLLLGIAAADMKPGYARRFLQHGATLGGLAAMTAEILPWLTSAGLWGPVAASAKTKATSLGAHVAAIGAIGAACAALDAADDLQLTVGAHVDGGDGFARLTRREQADLGKVARRAGGGTAKITASMPPPRIDLGLDSPITQRIASSRFDLPQPLGPTMPVSPRLDPQLGGFDEALEAGQLEAADLHRSVHRMRLGRRRAPTVLSVRLASMPPRAQSGRSAQTPAAASRAFSVGQAAVFSSRFPLRMNEGVPGNRDIS